MLDLGYCWLTALPVGIEALAGLKSLVLSFNELSTLPAGLGRLRNLEEPDLDKCPGLAALDDLQKWEGLPALLAHLMRGPASGGRARTHALSVEVVLCTWWHIFSRTVFGFHM